MKDRIVNWLSHALDKFGIDPIYFSTLVGIATLLYFKDEFIHWKTSQLSNRLLAISVAFGTSILIILSIFKLLGM